MNYFEYFSEIEERFTSRRGSLLLLSTLDWALIETWRDAGIPLAAVLRGIDDAFDKHDQRKLRARGRLSKVNGLAWCAQAVMGAATAMADAAVGARPGEMPTPAETGFEVDSIASYLEKNARKLQAAAQTRPEQNKLFAATASRLSELARQLRETKLPGSEELDLHLTALEEKLQASVLASMPENDLVELKSTADRELAPYRSRLGAVQLRQIREQFLHKKIFELYGLPRLSLFYLPMAADSGTPSDGDEAVA